MRKTEKKEQELVKQFSFAEEAEFSEILTAEEFRQIVYKVYRKKTLLSSLEVVGTNVIGQFYSRVKRRFFGFSISYNHDGIVDGKFMIRLEYKENVPDDRYIIEAADDISYRIQRYLYLRRKPFGIRSVLISRI